MEILQVSILEIQCPVQIDQAHCFLQVKRGKLKGNLSTRPLAIMANALPTELQWNLSIADNHYSGHPSIADTFSRKQLSPAIVKSL